MQTLIIMYRMYLWEKYTTMEALIKTNQGDMISANKWARIDRYILHSKNGFINFPGIFKNLKKIVS